MTNEQRDSDTILHQAAVEGVIDDQVEAGVGQDNAAIADAATNASVAHALNATFSDTEVEAALNALATIVNANAVKQNLILAALRNNGIVDTA